MAQIQKISTGSAIVQAALDRYYGGGQAKVLWVCNRSGVPAGDGSSPDRPLSALFGASGALAKLNATTSRGHVIFVMPGHAESVSAADIGSHQGAANSFAIVGLGGKMTRPSFTWTAAAGTWLLDTNDIALDNLQLFMAGATTSTTALTVAAAMTVSGNGCAIRNCYIQIGVDADQIITLGVVVTGDQFTFENNRVIGAVAAEITAAGTFMRLTGADDCVIRNNYIAGALATDTDGLIETLTTASTNVQVTDNELYACGAGNTCAVDFGADLVNTGTLRRNLLTVDTDGTAGTVVFTVHVNSNVSLLDNFLVNNNNERGLVIGTASV